jgi:hypothetical protein
MRERWKTLGEKLLTAEDAENGQRTQRKSMAESVLTAFLDRPRHGISQRSLALFSAISAVKSF